VRRAKLYYLRGLTGKKARIREKLDLDRDVLPPEEDAPAEVTAAADGAAPEEAKPEKAEKPKKEKAAKAKK
jgi:large subunit ribosomal protein L19